MLNQPVAIIGGGNIGHAMAADLTLGGYKVNFYEHPQFADKFKATLDKRIVEIENLQANRTEQAKIHKVTTDMGEAIGDVKLILMALPTFGQELFFNTMIPHLKDGQAVVLMTGNFGSIRLYRLLKERAPERKVTIYETSTQPYAARLTGPAKVSSHWGFGPWFGNDPASLKAFLDDVPEKGRLISAMPAKDTNVALKEFQELYPLFTPAKNSLVTALNNVNFGVHPVNIILNAGRIEYAALYAKCEFRPQREGHTPSVQRVEAAAVDEISAMVEALGGEMTTPRMSGRNYFDHAQHHHTPVMPIALIKARFITEDIPYGFVPMSQLGEKVGVPTPLIDAFIRIVSIMNEEDYRKIGRGLEALGLAELTKEQMIEFVEEGT